MVREEYQGNDSKRVIFADRCDGFAEKFASEICGQDGASSVSHQREEKGTAFM